MDDNLQIELLGKLASEKEISRLLRNRKREYVTESILHKHLEDYESNGWEIDKEFKNSVRVKKAKPLDIEFEDTVWSLFAQLGFKFLNRDRQFHLPYDKNQPKLTQQIDVFAKDDETILIVECKTSQATKIGDFKKELEAMSGKIEGLRRSISGMFPNVKHKIKYILATKNLLLNDEDKKRLDNLHGYHFDEDIIKYFKDDLFRQLGTASKYQLLALLFEGQDIPELDSRVPAVEGTMGGHKYYSFSIEPEKLLKIGFVLHRTRANASLMPTYQRIIKRARLKAVNSFVDAGGYFPNSIVVSIDAPKAKDCHFERANTQVDNTKSAAGILHLPKKYRSAYIIDGQHRLYGYADSQYKASNTIPVVAFINLDREEQIRLFMQINENQKSVPKNLQNTLNADLLWTSANLLERRKALCASVGIELGENKRSPLFDCIAIGEDVRPITTQAVENALKRNGFLAKVSKTEIEQLGSLDSGNIDQAFKKITQYLTLALGYIKDGVPEEWDKGGDGMLVINKGIYGLIMICGDIVAHLNENDILNSGKATPAELFDETKHFLDPVINYLLELDSTTKAEMKSMYGSTGDTWYWRVFQRAIHENYPVFNPDGMEKWFRERDKENIERAFEIVHDVEAFLNTDFRDRLKDKFGPHWFKKGVPPDVGRDAVQLAYDKNREIDDEADEIQPWSCLHLIDYKSIAKKNWKDFLEINYTLPGEEKINGGAEAKTKWIERLNKIRNNVSHASPTISDDDLAYLEQLYEWLITKSIRNKYQEEQ